MTTAAYPVSVLNISHSAGLQEAARNAAATTAAKQENFSYNPVIIVTNISSSAALWFINGKQGSGGVLQSLDNQVLTIEC